MRKILALSLFCLLCVTTAFAGSTFFPWNLSLGGGNDARRGELSLLTSLPSFATFTGGPQYAEDNAETLKTAGADEAQFPGMRLVTTVADGAKLGPDICVNGEFDTDSIWVKETGWSIADGVATQNGAGSGNLAQIYQTAVGGLIGKMWTLTLTVVTTNGKKLQIRDGSGRIIDFVLLTIAGETYTFYSDVPWASGGSFYIEPVLFIGSIDNISVREVIPTWLPTASDGAKNHPTISGVPQFYPNRQEYEDVGPTSEFRTTKGDTTESLDHYYESDEPANDLVVNGGFDTDTSSWLDGSDVGGAIAWNTEEALDLIYTSGIARAYQSVTTIIGYTYIFTLNRCGTSGGVLVGTTPFAGDLFNDGVNNTNVNIVFTAITTTSVIGLYNTSGIFTVDDISIKVVPKTSLTPLPRDSSGRFYENLVKNGGFDVDAEWTKGTGWTIGSGVASCDGTQVSTSDMAQNTLVVGEIGKRCKIIYDLYVSAGAITYVAIGGAFDHTDRTVSGTYTQELVTVNTAVSIGITANSSFIGSIDNVIVTEVDALGNPTNILDGGWRENTSNYLLNSGTPATQTTGSLSAGWYSLLTWGNTGSVAVTAGTATISGLTGAASDTVPAYFEVTVAGTVTLTETGTVDKFQLSGGVCGYHQANYIPTTSATVTQPANVDDAVVWQYAGRYQDRVGYLSEESRTNMVLHSQDFSNAVWTSLDVSIVASTVVAPDGTLSAYKLTRTGGVGFGYLLQTAVTVNGDQKSIWARTVSGTGKVTLLKYHNYSSALFDLTEKWQRFELPTNEAEVGGSNVYAVDFRAVGATLTEIIIWQAQSETGSFATSPIITEAATVTRPATVCELPSGRYIRANDFAAQGYCIPEGAGQTGTIWSSYTDANNYTSLGISATEVILNKRISGTSHTATVTYSHAADILFEWQAFFDSADGIGLRTREWSGLAWGAWEAWATDVTATDIAVPATIQIGSIDDGAQFNGTEPYVVFKKTTNPKTWLAANTLY